MFQMVQWPPTPQLSTGKAAVGVKTDPRDRREVYSWVGCAIANDGDNYNCHCVTVRCYYWHSSSSGAEVVVVVAVEEWWCCVVYTYIINIIIIIRRLLLVDDDVAVVVVKLLLE